MTTSRRGHFGALILGLAAIALLAAVLPVFSEEIKAIGEVESLYRNRVSLRVLDIVSPASGTASIKVGDRVSFNLPKVTTRRDKSTIGFGNVIEADLEGNVATEYDKAASDTPTVASGSTSNVLIWTAKHAERVKNPRKYREPGDGDAKGKGRHHRKNRKKDPPQTWTQEEVVSGKVYRRNKRLYLKEDRLRPKDKGLDVVDDVWYEKLKPFEGQKVVVYGTTHRVSLSSGPVELKNIMKVYPK